MKQERRKRPAARGREKATTPDPKILCILDPTRRVEVYTDTKEDSSWLTATDLVPVDVSQVLECEGLRGYVFPDPKRKDAVRIYDWVSHTYHPLGFVPQLRD